MEPRVSIITIAVDDLDRAVRFYEAMGLKRTPASPTASRFSRWAARSSPCSRARAPKRIPGIAFGAAPSAHLLAYNTRSEAEVDEVLAAAEKAGGNIVKPARRAFWGGWYGYFADTEGHIWEVAHNPDFPIDAEGNISLPG